MNTNELESRRDEQERNEWMESYLKSKGVLNLVDVATMDMPSEASQEQCLKEEDDFEQWRDVMSNYKVLESMIKYNAQSKIKKVNQRNKRLMRNKANASFALSMISNNRKYPRKRFNRNY